MPSYLVIYNYGTGGVWRTMTAPDAQAITRKYPRLSVVDHRPDWMTDELCSDLPVSDLEDEPDGFLRSLNAEPPSGN
jgi:hypothetical protein